MSVRLNRTTADRLTRDASGKIRAVISEVNGRPGLPDGNGELLLDEHLYGLVEAAAGLGMKVKIYTNGSLVDREAASRLFGRGVAMVVKVHSLDPALCDRLAGVNGAWRRCPASWISLCDRHIAHSAGR